VHLEGDNDGRALEIEIAESNNETKAESNQSNQEDVIFPSFIKCKKDPGLFQFGRVVLIRSFRYYQRSLLFG
jgi:hypothetical protein